jgi:aspartyl-tRNA(Asn)/glutamyl-tRNA(Gln) amidotransferase subunit B
LAQDKTKIMRKENRYQPIIGLEIHVELKTKSKMFCACSAIHFGVKPNTHTCPICLGLPGSLPVPNRKAIELCVLTGMALNCKIPRLSKFDRKNYFYPDLPKGYQISQYDMPFCVNGRLNVETKRERKQIGINRVHLEEDTGKLIHALVEGEKCTLIDFNRAGVPLMEIVSEPDLRNVEEVRDYTQKIRQLVRYLEVSEADMEKGQIRYEVNISLQKAGEKDRILPDYKVEVKNLNSFKFVEKAVEYEIKRQERVLLSGRKVLQETRGWDEVKQETVSQRGKEAAHDYRYFPEPDIPPIRWTQKKLRELKAQIPELPDEKKRRFRVWFGLTSYEAKILTEERSLADWYEEALRVYVQTVWPGVKISRKRPKEPVAISAFAKPLANWFLGEVLRRLKEKGITINNVNFTPAQLAKLLYLIDKGKVSQTAAKKIFVRMFETGESPLSLVEKLGLGQIGDEDQLLALIDETLKEIPKAVSDYKKGKKEVLGFLVGKIMQKTSGRADPKKTSKLLLDKLKKLL